MYGNSIFFTISAIKLFGNNSSLDINYDSSDKFINKNRNSNLKVEMPFENDENTTDKVSNPQEITKDIIYERMLNTIDYFTSVSGSFEYVDRKISKKPIKVDYDVVLGNNPKTYENVVDTSGSITKVISDEDIAYRIYEDDKAYRKFPSNSSVVSVTKNIKATDRVSYDSENQVRTYSYRIDTTNTMLARMSIFPQELTFGFLSDFSTWEIEGKENLLGYDAVILSGNLSGDYSKKLNVKTFKFWVEPSTGIILKYEGYNNGIVNESLITTKFNLDSKVNVLTIDEFDLSGYKFIN